MEQIKLLMLIFITICGYFTYKRNQNTERDKNSVADRGLIMQEVQLVKKQQSQPAVPKTQTSQEIDIQRFISQQTRLFNIHTTRLMYPSQPEDKKNTNDINDIFGGEYQKCKQGKVYEMDSDTVLYSNNCKLKPTYFNQQSYYRQSLPDNQALCRGIQESINNEPFYIDNPILMNVSQQPNSFFDLTQFKGLNNSPFNFNFKGLQKIQMIKQHKQSQQQQSSSNLTRKLKKKTITKLHKKPSRVRLLKKKPLAQTSSNQPKPKFKLLNPHQSKKTSRFNKFICLEQEIKKKQQQLAVLKRLYQSTDDI